MAEPEDDRISNDPPMARPRRDPVPFDEDGPVDRPRRGGKKSGGGGIATIFIVLGVLAVVIVGCGGLAVALMLPAVHKVRDAANRTKSMNNMKQIGIAILNYHSVNGRFPRDRMTIDGKPGLSWRVEILPYLEQSNLYNQFRLDEPWDGPANLALSNTAVSTFMMPDQTDFTKTHYLGFAGANTIFDPNQPKLTMMNIVDGTSNTIMIVEAKDAMPWAKPGDLTFTPTTAIKPLLNWRGGAATVLMADGSIHLLSDSDTDTNLRNAITINDGIPVKLP